LRTVVYHLTKYILNAIIFNKQQRQLYGRWLVIALIRDVSKQANRNMLTILALKDNHSMKEFSAVGFSPKQHQHKSINSAILAFMTNHLPYNCLCCLLKIIALSMYLVKWYTTVLNNYKSNGMQMSWIYPTLKMDKKGITHISVNFA
jgi:hypothetical protein